jgi:hypothetical protein
MGAILLRASPLGAALALLLGDPGLRTLQLPLREYGPVMRDVRMVEKGPEDEQGAA